ncbi:J domain-containing protein, partial [archaeon]
MSSSGGSAAAAAASTARHYAVLGVAPGSSEAVIKKAYYAAALKDHPDKNPGDAQAAARFMAIHAAYEALQDEALRQEYERYMSAQAAAAVRASEMDVGRKRLRSELEAREAAAAQAAAASRAPAQGAGGQVAGSRVARGATTDARIAALRAEGRDAMAAAHVAGVATRPLRRVP